MDVVDFGPISILRLPDDWQENYAETPYHGSSCRTFSPQGKEEEFKLNLWSRGTPLSSRAEIKFAAILGQPEHALTEHELEALTEVLANMGKKELFTISQARTISVGGKRVLLVGGDWISLNKKSVGMFVPVDDCSKVEEVYCLCEPDAFQQYEPTLAQLFSSVRWQS